MLGKTFTPAGARRARPASAATSSSRCSASLVRKEVLVAPGRPALAGARPVRLPAGPRPPRRLRDALEARAARPPPRRGRASARGVRRTRTRSSRWSPRTTSTPTRRRPTPTTRPRSASGRARRSSAPASAPSRSAPPAEAQRYFAQAAELTDDAARAGRRCSTGPAGSPAHAADLDGAAAAARARRSRSTRPRASTHAAARVSGRLADVERWQGRLDEALERMERRLRRARRRRAGRGPRRCSPRGSAAAYFFAGELDRARRAARAGARRSPRRSGCREVLAARVRRSRSIIAQAAGRPQEALAFLEQALEIALEHDLPSSARRDLLQPLRPRVPSRPLRRTRSATSSAALALARRRGNRPREWSALAEMTYPLYMLGRWDEALAAAAADSRGAARTTRHAQPAQLGARDPHPPRRAGGGAPRALAAIRRRRRTSRSRARTSPRGAAVLHAEGRLEEALAAASSRSSLPRADGVQLRPAGQAGLSCTRVEAALALGRRAQAEELLAQVEELPPGFRPPYLEAHAHRFRARLDGDEAGYRAAAARFAELGHAVLGRGDPARARRAARRRRRGGAARAAARETFERLEATPWLERASAAAAGRSRPA